MTEAEARYLDRIAEDCAQLLGPAGRVERLDVESNDHVALRLFYRIGRAVGVSEGRGESWVAAHADLLDKLRRDWPSVLLRTARTRSSFRRVRMTIAALAIAIGLGAFLLGPSIVLIVLNLSV